MDQEGGRPLGVPGLQLTYSYPTDKTLPGSVAKTFDVTLGPVEQKSGAAYQWLQLHAVKENRETFSLWLLCSRYPADTRKAAQSEISRYILQKGDAKALKFRSKNRNAVVLPNTDVWPFLLPRNAGTNNPIASLAERVSLLRHKYLLKKSHKTPALSPMEDADIVSLTPDFIIGVPHNIRQKDDTWRYDQSDYEYIRLTKDDYTEMIEAGLNCFRVDAEQAA